MSYECHNSTDRFEQYRARQAARIEAISAAVDEGRTRVVSSIAPPEKPVKVIKTKRSPAEVRFEVIGQGGAILAKSNHELPNAGQIVSQAIKPKLRMHGAAEIKPQDGDVFVYNAETDQLEKMNYRVVKSRGYVRRFKRKTKLVTSIGETVVATIKTAFAVNIFKK